MPRVAGVDPGTVTIDACVLDDGRLVADRAWARPSCVSSAVRRAGSAPASARISPSGPTTIEHPV